MKLRTQIIGFGLVGTLLAGLAGGIGLFASSRLGGALEDAIQDNGAKLNAQAKEHVESTRLA